MKLAGLVCHERFRLKNITSLQNFSHILIMSKNWRIKNSQCIKYPAFGFSEIAAIERIWTSGGRKSRENRWGRALVKNHSSHTPCHDRSRGRIGLVEGLRETVQQGLVFASGCEVLDIQFKVFRVVKINNEPWPEQG